MAPKKEVVWTLDNLETIGGHTVTVLGNPKVIETPDGRAVAFDGVADGLIVPANPLTGWKGFNIEVEFCPAAGGQTEQRFVHVHADDRNRVLVETRLTEQNTWFTDTFVFTDGVGQTLYADGSHHPLDQWYRIKLLCAMGRMSHYVNDEWEMSSRITYKPSSGGQTSLGVRINRQYWFKGAIRKVTFRQDE